jgi:hypothetical protein
MYFSIFLVASINSLLASPDLVKALVKAVEKFSGKVATLGRTRVELNTDSLAYFMSARDKESTGTALFESLEVLVFALLIPVIQRLVRAKKILYWDSLLTFRFSSPKSESFTLQQLNSLSRAN